MKSYNIKSDLKIIRQYFDLNQDSLAKSLSISRASINRYEKGITYPEKPTLELIYSFAYGRHGEKLKLNENKSQFYLDDCGNKKLLFYGEKGDIEGDIDIFHSEPPNDFGDGFYAGETYFQAASWVSLKNNSSVYCFYFDSSDLTSMRFNVDRKWMYAILFYRGAFENKKIPEEVQKVVDEVESCDYLIAPIADNEMYRILNRFIDNEISDEACLHALATTNLGMQYVFKTMKACKKLLFIDRLYLCANERSDLEDRKNDMSDQSSQKADLAIIEYNRKGKMFNELFKGI